MINERKELILDIIIKEHIKTGLPVSSSMLVEKYNLDCSSATVRNEMADLEEAGWIKQPHTSAGRIPTETAYRWFVSRLNSGQVSTSIKEGELAELAATLGDFDEYHLKQTAKMLATASGLAVFWAFHRRSVYYTGVTNLFSQPEFASQNLVYDISAIIDRLDDIIHDSFDDLPDDVGVLLGSECPFGPILGSVSAKVKNDGHVGTFGVIGPMRMDYQKVIELISFIKKEFDK